jgi:hypothetical protein
MLVLPVAVAVNAFMDGWLIALGRPGTDASFAQLIIGVFYLDATLLGAWSALYYAINFFLRVEEQNDMLLRLEARPRRRNWRCCAISSTRISCSTRSTRSPRWCCWADRAGQCDADAAVLVLRYTLVNEPTAA